MRHVTQRRGDVPAQREIEAMISKRRPLGCAELFERLPTGATRFACFVEQQLEHFELRSGDGFEVDERRRAALFQPSPEVGAIGQRKRPRARCVLRDSVDCDIEHVQE